MMNRFLMAAAVVSMSLIGVGCSEMSADNGWNSSNPANTGDNHAMNANSQSVPNRGMPDYQNDSSKYSHDSQNSTARNASDQGSLSNPDGTNQPGVNNSSGPQNSNSGNMGGTASEGR